MRRHLAKVARSNLANLASSVKLETAQDPCSEKMEMMMNLKTNLMVRGRYEKCGRMRCLGEKSAGIAFSGSLVKLECRYVDKSGNSLEGIVQELRR